MINLIDIENMYDVVFGFETHFQKLGYRVWEKYKIRAYTHDVTQVISEDGFGNDDHIPVTKKLILIAGLTPECGKLTTALAQIYLDQEIGIEADYAKRALFPNHAESKSSPLNVMARAQYLKKFYHNEFDIPGEQTDLYERGLEKHTFIQQVYKQLKKPVPEYLSDYIFGQLPENQFDAAELKEMAQQYVDQLLQDSKDPDLSAKLESLLGEE